MDKIKMPSSLEQKRGFLQRCKNKQITVAEMNQICPGLNLQAKHLPLFCEELERFEKHPYYLSFQEYEMLRNKMVHKKQRKRAARNIPLVDLMPAESVGMCGKKSCMTVYHGTDMKSLNSLLTDLSADVGGGSLGQGFYFTPVFEQATHYAKRKAKDSKTDPIVLEFHIIDYEGLRVQFLNGRRGVVPGLKIKGHQTIISDGTLYPIWQFNCKDTLTLKTHFRVSEVFVLPV